MRSRFGIALTITGMADDSESAPAQGDDVTDATSEKKAPAGKAPAEEQFTVEHLIEECRARMDVSPYVLRGALHGYEKDYITVSEAQVLVDDFMTREESRV